MWSAPPPGPLLFGQPGDAFVIQQNLSAVGNVEPGEARQQRRFSASRGPDKRDELSRLDREADPAKRPRLVLARVVKSIDDRRRR